MSLSLFLPSLSSSPLLIANHAWQGDRRPHSSARLRHKCEIVSPAKRESELER